MQLVHAREKKGVSSRGGGDGGENGLRWKRGGKEQKLKVVERLKEGSVCRGTKQP